MAKIDRSLWMQEWKMQLATFYVIAEFIVPLNLQIFSAEDAARIVEDPDRSAVENEAMQVLVEQWAQFLVFSPSKDTVYASLKTISSRTFNEREAASVSKLKKRLLLMTESLKASFSASVATQMELSNNIERFQCGGHGIRRIQGNPFSSELRSFLIDLHTGRWILNFPEDRVKEARRRLEDAKKDLRA
jgi:hypothetical protein